MEVLSRHPRLAYDPFAGPALAYLYATTDAQREVFTAADWGADASCAFNESFSLRLTGRLDEAALRRALAGLGARHEALRTVFSPDGATACVAAELPLPVGSVDWRGLPAAERERQTAALLAAEVSSPFDLVRGPLARFTLVRYADDGHLLVACLHHLACDGWSAAVLVKDCAALYSAAVDGATAPLAAPARMSDYAAAEAGRAADAATGAALAYWADLYKGGAPQLELPLDAPRPPLRTVRAGREDLDLPPALLAKLRTVGADAQCSLFVVLLSGFYALLARLTAQDSFVVGVPAAGQAAGGEHTLVGHCVNLLPLLARVDPAEPFTALMARVRAAVLDGYEHQQVTFGRILRQLTLPRDPARPPLVPVMFNLDQDLGAAHLAFAGLAVQFATTPRRFETFELFLNVVQAAGRTTLECQYNADLFTAGAIRSRLTSLAALLSCAAERPGTPVGALEVLAPAERRRLLETWNAVEPPPPPRATLAAMVQAQAEATPERAAVADGGAQLTYRELEARANRLAHHLAGLGVKAGDRVGVALDRSVDLLVGLLGILKTGAAYVPIDPAYPVARLRMISDDAGLRALVTTAATAGALPVLDAAVVVRLDADAGRIAACPAAPLAGVAEDPERTAYVIFTSGSTGRPKGVLVPQRAVTNFLASMREAPGLAPEDTLLAVTTVAFDIHVLELFLPLVCGALVVLASAAEAADPGLLREALARSGATVMQATPATWQMLVTAGWEPTHPRLKALCGGEPLPPALAEALLARTKSLWNMYGPTETTVWSTCHRVTAGRAPVPIGRPIGNTRVYVVDALLQPVPVGVAGELLIGGAGVATGYLGQPELTAERFVASRWCGPDAGRLYRTGDLARWRDDGTLECLGRRDQQVKIRGFRVELGDIEAVLAAQPEVVAAAAGVRERSPGDPRLVAWYTAVAPGGGDAATLRRRLAQALPAYLVPQQLVELAALPLTPNGKLDRQRLPSPFAAAVGPDPARPVGRRAPRAGSGAVALSAEQQALLALEAATPGVALCNLPTAFRLAGRVDAPALGKALEALVRRHDALRTAFVPGPGGELQQQVRADAPATLATVDLRARPRAGAEAQVTAELLALAEERFDLSQAPLLKVRLYQLGEEESVLFIMAHHGVWDGWSFDLFIKELSALYVAAQIGGTSPLAPLALQYADYSEGQRQAIRAGFYGPSLQFWRQELAAKAPPAALPTDRPRPRHPSHRGASVAYAVPRGLADALTLVGQAAGASLFMVLLTAFDVLLYRLTGERDVVVGTPVRGRGEPGTDGVIGVFVNQVALGVRLDRAEPFAALLRRVRRGATEAFGHDQVPFSLLRQELGLEAPRVVFSFQDARERAQTFGALTFQQLNIEPTACPAELNFWLKESHAGLTGSLNYATELFDRATIDGMLAAFDGLLAAIVRDPGGAVGGLGPDSAEGGDAAGAVGVWLQGTPQLEAALASHPLVAAAAAGVLPGTHGSCRLAAFFALKPGEYLTASDLRRHLRSLLPAALVPQILAEVEGLPRLAGGGVDKLRLLAAQLPAAGGSEAAAVAPGSAAERLLAEVWEELLGVGPVGRQANFFELGGHSLLAIQMIAVVERRSGVRLNRMAVTLNTLAQIAAAMPSGADTAAPAPASTIAPGAAATPPGAARGAPPSAAAGAAAKPGLLARLKRTVTRVAQASTP